MGPAKLTTHVLDIAAGVPAAGVAFALHRFAETFSGDQIELGAGFTDADGRSPQPLPAEGGLEPGTYALDFDVGSYFAASEACREGDGFLGIVSVRFRISDVARQYHIPLLVSPFGYTTYRGS